MSDALHQSRVWWQSGWGRGGVVHGGVSVALTQRPPVLLDMGRLVEIEFSPLTGIYIVQRPTGAKEDMTEAHRIECWQYLRAVAAGGREIAEGWRP